MISCYGARKGIIDTALRTSRAGYLTRRIVDIAHFQVISIVDCNTRRRINIFPLMDQKGKIVIPFINRIKGRAIANPIPIVGNRNTFLRRSFSQKIIVKYQRTLFRSSLTCRAKFLAQLTQKISSTQSYRNIILDYLGFSSPKIRNRIPYFTLCQYCYGWRLSDICIVNIGESVGILAAQSIGEPGTQITMRTFHTGGVFVGETSNTFRRVSSGIVTFQKIIKGLLTRSKDGEISFFFSRT